jgi:hypothetical protein
MSVTFPHPQIHRPDFRRYAFAGVAILATAVAITGVRAVVTSDSPVSAPTTADVSGLTTPAHTLGTPSSNYYNSLDSLGVVVPAPATIAPTSADQTAWMAADAGSLGVVVPAPATNATTSADQTAWMAADAGSLGVVPEG